MFNKMFYNLDSCISRLYISFTVQQQPTDICIIKLFLHQSQNLLNNQKRRKFNPNLKKYRCMTNCQLNIVLCLHANISKCFHQNRVKYQPPLKTAKWFRLFISVFKKMYVCMVISFC